MAQLLQAPTEGYEDAIVVPAITADNFELKHGLLTLVQNKQFFRHDKEDPHAHIQYFNKITSTLKFPNVLNTLIKLMLFPFFLEGTAWIWLEKEPPRSIFTWDDLFKDLLRASPYHGFSELHQLDTIYNALNSKDQDSLNSAAGVVAKVSMNTSTSGISPDIAGLKDMVKALLLDKKSQNQAPATVKAVKESCVVENEPEATKDTVHPTNNGSTEDVQPPVVSTESPILTSEPVNSPIIEPVASPVSAPRPNQRPSIPYPSRLQDQNLRNKANDQREKFFQIFKDLNFNISFPDALILMPKFGPSIKSFLTNKDKLCELARTPPNEHCSTILLNKLPKKLGDPGKYLIPCDFSGKAECLALVDLDASINLMPLPEVLGFFDVIASGNPTPYYDPIVSTTSPTLTLFGNSDFLLEEVDAFLALEDDPTLLKVDQSYLDSKRDIPLLEAFLNDDPSLPPPHQGNYLPEVRKELKICEAKSDKSSIDKPLEVELKDLPPHLEYALTIKDFELVVQHQRGVNPKIHDVIKQEFLKLLDAGLIYPISDSLWVSPVHCVPKKGGFTVVENEENELILTRLVTGWCVCIDYSKLNEATRKDHFPLPFMDQMLERLVGNQYYCFLDGFSGYFQIPIDLKDQEKTTFTYPYGTLSNTQKKLIEAPILIAPDWDMPFELMCDASDFAIGAVLGQRQEKHFRPIHYASKTMTEAESNYTTTEKEMIAWKTKRLHDSNIKDRVFNIGDRVLLFNSRLNIFSGKLKSRWSGLFTISHVYPYGTVELSQPNGPNFKVNGYRVKHYFGEDVPKMVVPDLQTFPKDH
nr:reverse transcriptase domain-containing protein [Tanacetum cinerariifolium]